MSDKLNFCKKHGTTYVHECHSCYREQSACIHGVPFDSECGECEEDAQIVKAGKERSCYENPNNLIENIQKERESVYGKFSEQAEFVGKMIHEFEMVAVHNEVAISHRQRGAVAYVAMKLARYAVSHKHEDTLTDLESYCNLIKKMELGE